METEKILSKLINLMKKLCPKEGVDYDKATLETGVFDDLGLTSIEVIMVAIGIEKEFDVVIQGVDFSSFKKVGDVVRYIEENEEWKFSK